jgi:lipopolysaccharide transport system permease protein
MIWNPPRQHRRVGGDRGTIRDAMTTVSDAPHVGHRLLPSLIGLGPMVLVRRLSSHRFLLRQLVRKGVVTTYQGSMIGVAWIVVRPLLTLAIYGFCFGVVFQGRFFRQTNGGPFEFAMVLFIGLTIFSVLSEMLSVAPSLVAGNANFVKRVVFPLDLLVPAQLGSALAQMTMSAAVFLAVRVFLDPPLGWAALSVPIVLLPYLMLTLGLSWFLASLGVFVRDLQQVVPLAITGLMFLSPLFYPVSALPPVLQSLVYLNPLTFIVESARNALFRNEWPDPIGLVVYFVFAGFAMWLGWAWFEKTKKGFADVL